MQNIVPLSYDYVFSLAQQLSPEEQEMLARGIISHPTANKTKTTNILPSLNKEEMAARKQRLLEKALKCPILSEEELKNFTENCETARKEINECRLASL